MITETKIYKELVNFFELVEETNSQVQARNYLKELFTYPSNTWFNLGDEVPEFSKINKLANYEIIAIRRIPGRQREYFYNIDMDYSAIT